MTHASLHDQVAGLPISLLVLAYNQATTIESAVQSALGQACEPIEIILSDDASSDDTYRLMTQLADAYRGPHHVRVRRNARNLGIGEHYNVLVAEARGELLVTAAGDDLSEPHRVQAIAQAWRADGRRADLIASHVRDLDMAGNPGAVLRVDDLAQWRSVDDWCRRRPHVIGAAHAFTRRLWDRFGPLDADVAYEDQVITLRALLGGGGLTVDDALVQYRRGGTSAALAPQDAAAFLGRARVLQRRNVAEHRQLVADATRAGCGEAVSAALRPAMDRNQFVLTMLEAPGHLQALRLALASRTATWPWRLRRMAYLRWPGLGSASRRLQARWRSLWRR